VYTDAETFLAAWLITELSIKAWADPNLKPDWKYEAPVHHIQRAPGEGDAALTLDSALINIDTYSAKAANAREEAELVRHAIRVTLPHHTTANGVFVQATQTVMAPIWTPDPKVYRRSATYQLFLHNPGM
jgi:hypothetical protein